MAGIGEVSAIITVAQLGLSLASALIAFVGEYREAESRISCLSNEIGVTSGCLQRLGDLAQRKGLYGDRGALEASSLTERCRVVIFEIRTTLKKGDDPLDPKVVKKSEVEISCFDKLKWAAWSQRKLDVPRAELERLKADITLTFVSLMAVGASTQAEKNLYAGDIPGITKTLKWANKKYEEAVNRQAHVDGLSHPPTYNGHRDSAPLQPTREASYVENEAEEWKSFIEFKKSKVLEEQEKRLQEELKRVRLMEEQMQEEERLRTEKIRVQTIAEYEAKRREEEAERETQIREAKLELRRRLEDAHISEDQIQAVLSGTSSHQALVPFHPKPITNDDNLGPDPAAVAPETKQHANILSRIQNKFRKLAPASSHDAFQRHIGPGALQDPYVLEAWAIDQFFQHRFRIPLSDAWLAKYIARQEKEGGDIGMWRRYSKLHPWYKKEISELFEEKLQDKKYVWSMISLEKVVNRRRSGLLKQAGEQICLQLTLKRSRYNGGARYVTTGVGGPNVRPPHGSHSSSSLSLPSSLPGAQYSPSVSTRNSNTNSRQRNIQPRKDRDAYLTPIGTTPPKGAKVQLSSPCAQSSSRKSKPILLDDDYAPASKRSEPEMAEGDRYGHHSFRGPSHPVVNAKGEPIYGGRVETVIAKDLVDTKVLDKSGLPFYVEDDKVVIRGDVKPLEVDQLIRRSGIYHGEDPFSAAVTYRRPVRSSHQAHVAFQLPPNYTYDSDETIDPYDLRSGGQPSARTRVHPAVRDFKDKPFIPVYDDADDFILRRSHSHDGYDRTTPYRPRPRMRRSRSDRWRFDIGSPTDYDPPYLPRRSSTYDRGASYGYYYPPPLYRHRRFATSGRGSPYGYDSGSRDRYEDSDKPTRIFEYDERDGLRERRSRGGGPESEEATERRRETRDVMGKRGRMGEDVGEVYVVRRQRSPSPAMGGPRGASVPQRDYLTPTLRRSFAPRRSSTFLEDDWSLHRRPGNRSGSRERIARKDSFGSVPADLYARYKNKAGILSEVPSYAKTISEGNKWKERAQTDAEIIEKQLALYTGDRPGPQTEAGSSRPSGPFPTGSTGDQPLPVDVGPVTGNALHEEPETISRSPSIAAVIEEEYDTRTSIRTKSVSTEGGHSASHPAVIMR